MGFFSRKKKAEFSYSYHSSRAQADAARHLCDQLNEGRKRLPTKARERGLGYHFDSRDDNGFVHHLCMNEIGMAVPLCDLYRSGGVGGGGGAGGIDVEQIMAMQRGAFQQQEGMHMMQVQAQMQQQQQQQRQQWEKQMAQQMLEHQQRGQGHATPPVQPSPYDTNCLPFRNPFKEPRPQGEYGMRAYVPGQERIKVRDHGLRFDDPVTSWNMMMSLEALRRGNQRG